MLKLVPNSFTADYPYKVLIVDDEEANRKLESAVLQLPEFLVTTACDGEQALQYLAEQEFDIVLLDKRMPGISGDEVCLTIRNKLNLQLLPVLIVTGNSAQHELEISLQSGANDFIRKPFSISELQAKTRAFAHQKRLIDQLDSAESMLFALARMVEAKDEGTGNHCLRLEHTASVFGESLGLDPPALQALRRGGVLHDIGKLGIPDSILLKKGPLTNEEWQVMRQHTVIGERLCSELKSMRQTLPIIRSHHERLDGSGYPDGLKGDEIPLIVRVFQILDIYDALASVRSYKPAFPKDKIISIFNEEVAKGWLDGELVDHFIEILNHRPNDLILPEKGTANLGQGIFDHITATGILQWGK